MGYNLTKFSFIKLLDGDGKKMIDTSYIHHQWKRFKAE